MKPSRYTAAVYKHLAALDAADFARLPKPPRPLMPDEIIRRTGAVESPGDADVIHCRCALDALPRLEEATFDPLFDGWTDDMLLMIKQMHQGPRLTLPETND